MEFVVIRVQQTPPIKDNIGFCTLFPNTSKQENLKLLKVHVQSDKNTSSDTTSGWHKDGEDSQTRYK